ncbi:MAG: MFS transporter, partial [Rhizorhabdus sp.]
AIPPAPPLPRDAIGNRRRMAPLLPVIATGCLWFVVMWMSGVKTPFVMALAGIEDHGTIASLYALNAGSVTVSSLMFGAYAARFDPITILRFAFLASAGGLCIAAVATTAPQFALALMVNGASAGVGLTALWTWGMRRAPDDLVARALGIMTTCLYLGGATSPFLTAPYEAMLGTRGQFFGVAATIVTVLLLLWLGRSGRIRNV